MATSHSKVPLELKKLVLKLKEDGKTYAEISKTIGRPRSTVQSVLQNYAKNKSFDVAPGRGRKKVLSAHMEREIERMVKADPKLSAPKIAADINANHGISVNPQTIRNLLHTKGYNGRTARKKPYISKANVVKRLNYANMYATKPDDFWKNVIFVDESKFNVFGSDGRRFVWRKANTALQLKNLQPTVKHGGGSLMVWGAMGANGVGNLVFIETTMDKHKYLQILKENVKASASKIGLQDDFVSAG